jgi:hypothetical protein
MRKRCSRQADSPNLGRTAMAAVHAGAERRMAVGEERETAPMEEEREPRGTGDGGRDAPSPTSREGTPAGRRDLLPTSRGSLLLCLLLCFRKPECFNLLPLDLDILAIWESDQSVVQQYILIYALYYFWNNIYIQIVLFFSFSFLFCRVLQFHASNTVNFH